VCCVLFERGVLFCVMCVICVLCLIVVPLSPGKTPFAVKINNNNNVSAEPVSLPPGKFERLSCSIGVRNFKQSGILQFLENP
jgi:hypothetical protein